MSEKNKEINPENKDTGMPERETPKAEAPKPEEPKQETSKVEAPKPEEPKQEAPKAEAPIPKPEEKKKEKPSNCAVCNKSIRKKRYYYRNGKYFCTQRCFKTTVKKASQEAKDKIGETGTK